MYQLKLSYLAAVSAGLLTFAAAASANDKTVEASSVVVQYADLDLTTDQGQQTLYRRVTVAAKKVCPTSDFNDIRQYTRVHACLNDTVARTLRSMGQPVLADRYLKGHTHG